MDLNRREFVVLSAGCLAGCAAGGGENRPVRLQDVSIDAGPVSAFEADRVYDQFRNRGFFIVRKGESLIALSAICTHRTCKLEVERDRSLHCPCHGSDFALDGAVLEGPATRGLPQLPTVVDERGHLMIKAVAM